MSKNEPSQEVVVSDDANEEGWRAWKIVLGAWCGLMPTFAIMNIGGVLESWLAQNELKEYSKTSISWIFSVWCLCLYLGGIFVGPIFDKYGIKYTVIPGSLGAIFSIMVLSVCTDYYQFILGFGIVGGLSFSTLITPSLGCIAHWFNKRRGLATGIACSSGGFGGIFFTLLFGALCPRIGFPWTIRVLGFICMLSCTVSILLLRTRQLTSKPASAKIDLRSLKEPVFLATCFSAVMAEAGLIIPVIYLPSYALAHGIDAGLSYQTMSIFNAASIVGRIIPGILADRLGRFNVMICTSSVCTILAFTLWLLADQNKAAILSFVALCGFWSGPAISLSPVCVAQVCETKDYGKRYGTVSLMIGFVLLGIIPLAGAILRVQNSSNMETNYSGLICLCGSAYACSSVLAFIAKGLKVGWRPTIVF